MQTAYTPTKLSANPDRSFGNMMLIVRQKPEATNVARPRTWSSLGRS
jgi:hypothetical protein